ncbi:MAG: cyclic nucleotide-binding/CBS domain-containing protein, partial [Gammaproteobacteria bacterium]
MEIEQLEIRDYLAQISPLDKLDGETLDQIALALEIAYVRRGGEILKVGEKNHWLYLVRTGAAEIVDADG